MLCLQISKMGRFYPPEASIEIEASIEQVWTTLLNAAAYPDWNSFIFEAQGNPQQIGTPVRMRVRLGSHTVRAVMASVSLKPPSEEGQAEWIHRHASWLARSRLVNSQRHHRLTSLKDGLSTRYETWETFSGPLKPFMPFHHIDAGFKQQAIDLKKLFEEKPKLATKA